MLDNVCNMKISTAIDYEKLRNHLNAFLEQEYSIDLEQYPNACDVMCARLKNR